MDKRTLPQLLNEIQAIEQQATLEKHLAEQLYDEVFGQVQAELMAALAPGERPPSLAQIQKQTQARLLQLELQQLEQAESLAVALSRKVDRYAYLISERLPSAASEYKDVADAWQYAKRRAEGIANNLKAILRYAAQHHDLSSLDGSQYRIEIKPANTPSFDDSLVQETYENWQTLGHPLADYLKSRQVVELDKAKLSAALKQGDVTAEELAEYGIQVRWTPRVSIKQQAKY